MCAVFRDALFARQLTYRLSVTRSQPYSHHSHSHMLAEIN